MTKVMVNIVRWLMIMTAIAMSPFWALWVAGGALCDMKDRRRNAAK